MFNNLNVLALSRQGLSHAAARHTLIARNIANADTPGYVALDLKTPKFDAAVARASSQSSVQLASTHPGHSRGVPMADRAASRGRETDMEVTPSGNGVELDIEAGKMAAVSSSHRFATAIYGKYVGMLKTALGGQG